MRYFTEDWCRANMSDQEIEQMQKNYSSYLETIFNKLPFGLKLLSRNISIHDGVVTNCIYSTQNNKLTLIGIFGDLEIGYFTLTLIYDSIIKLEGMSFENSFKTEAFEILADEIEVLDDSSFAHHLITTEYKEIDICFRNLSIQIVSANKQQYDSAKFCEFIAS